MSGIFDRIKAKIKSILDTRTIAERAAPRIEAKLRHDATTKRGNVPDKAPGPKGHPMADVPIRATASGDEVTVSAPEWVLRKANQLGQPAEWAEIVKDEARRR